jgi:cyclophilin family peptidyl-prolyl cis-trans isomerase
MAKHKGATEVNIATTEPQSEFSAIVHRFWLPALALFVGLGAFMAFMAHQSEAESAEAVESWASLGEAVQVDNPATFASADASLIAAVAKAETARAAGPWAKYLEASVRDQAGDSDGAATALAELEKNHPEHMLNTMSFTAGSSKETVVQRMRSNAQERANWEAAHPTLFNNPEPAQDCPRVKITTTEGFLVLALYDQEAPKHCENFLKHCSEGFYDGTKFHRVIANFMIQGGDPNTKEVDVDQWGQGGPGYKVAREENDLKHFVGYLAAAKMPGEVDSSGSQFYITTGPAHHLDGQHVVFGKIIDGMETARIVESSVIVPGTSRPEAPASVISTEIL